MILFDKTYKIIVKNILRNTKYEIRFLTSFLFIHYVWSM